MTSDGWLFQLCYSRWIANYIICIHCFITYGMKDHSWKFKKLAAAYEPESVNVLCMSL